MPRLNLENEIVDGRYHVLRRRGGGAYAEIYVTFDQHRQRTVVIKALNTTLQHKVDVALERTLVENFEREAAALESLRHPHIVQLLGKGTARSRAGTEFPYLVLEYMPGGELQTHCRHQQLTVKDTIYYFRQVCEALTTAHAHEIIHRDIKPSNLLLSADHMTIKVSDFGVAKLLKGARGRPVTRVGTELYSPPEHSPRAVGRQESLTPAADVYALSKTIYTVMTGLTPHEFRREQIHSLPPELMAPAWGPRLLEILRRATMQRVTDRYDSMSAFWKDFEELASYSENRQPHVRRRTKETPLLKRAEQQSRPAGEIAQPPRHSAEPAVQPARSRIVINLSRKNNAHTPPTHTAPVPHTARTQRKLDLHLCEFEIVSVDATGRLAKRSRGRAQCFSEELGDVSLEMVKIPAGKFLMGSPESEAGRSSHEGPQRRTSVRSFFVARLPVTQALWRSIAQGPVVLHKLNPNPSHFAGDNLPVENVSWYEAVEFCERLAQRASRAYRLLSESEWEYACRAGTTTPFSFGETITNELVNYDGRLPYGSGPKGAGREQTSVVGTLGGANGFGLFDFHGNVWEWCCDAWYENYGIVSGGKESNRVGNSESRVLRGGSWFNAGRLCRSAYRWHSAPESKSNTIGFRVALDIGGV